MKKRVYDRFVNRFVFRKELEGYIGIEREHFLLLHDGTPTPQSPEFLRRISDPRWTYELSACQVEARTVPHNDLDSLKLELLENENNAHYIAEKIGVALINQSVAIATMSLDVYPDDPRYEEIAKVLSPEQLRAACRVAGTHIHVGVGNIQQAINVYNLLVSYLGQLIQMSEGFDSERLALYKVVTPNWIPPHYEDIEDFFWTALENGFLENPRNCWNLIRISIHGTVELRMFGATDHVDEIIGWASQVRELITKKGVV